MGLRHPPSPTLINRSHPSNRIDQSTLSSPDILNTISNNGSNSNPRFHSSSMVTNYTKTNLIELNSQSDESCLVVISEKVYDLTLWIEDQLDLNSIIQLRTLAKVDPLNAGNWLVERLLDRNVNLIAECRIGDLDSMEHQTLSINQFPDCLDPGGRHLNQTNWNQNSHPNSNQTVINQTNNNFTTDHSSTPSTSSQEPNREDPNCTTLTQTSTSIPAAPRRSHLSRALALVEYHKSLVIAAEANVGSAHVSLAEAFEGLAEAEKKRDHLVMLACEGFRPTLPEWESLEDDQDGFGDLNV